LEKNHEVRKLRGTLSQDYTGRLPDEIFYANLTEQEYEALPLKCKRKGDLARTTGVLSKTYAEAYGDKESFAVYLHTYELEMLGIRYKF
jgi:hypothetical protein